MISTHEMGQWVGVKEASKIAGVHEFTIRRWCHGRVIEARQFIGRRKKSRGEKRGVWRIFVSGGMLVPTEGAR